MSKRLFTSEHVSPGHPDKVCDQISDAIIDAHYDAYPSTSTRVAVETLAKGNRVVLAGEITSKLNLDYRELVKETLEDIGYIPEVSPVFNTSEFELETMFTGQSPDIDACVSKKEIGAGDQGIMFGYAVAEAPDLTGWAHYLARNIVSDLWTMKLANDSTGLHSICPDFKVQVTMDYSRPFPRVDTILASVSSTPETDLQSLKDAVERCIRNTVSEIEEQCSVDNLSDSDWVGSEILDASDYKVLVNPYGPFTVFGPVADAGLTGRKIVCDQYGGYAPVGGGAFSGKDLTKVDRTAAYMARYVAKNTLHLLNNKAKCFREDLAYCGPYRDCSVEVAYVIGCAAPVSVSVKLRDYCGKSTYITGEELSAVFGCDIYEMFKPEKMIDTLELFEVDYSEVAKFGHIGCDSSGVYKPWETLIASSEADR